MRRSSYRVGCEIGRPMTRREEQVRQLVAEGMADKEIASQLDASLSTVRSHMSGIFRKTGLNKRGLVAAACWQARLEAVGS